MVLITSLEFLLGWERLSLFDLFVYVEMIRTFLLCRSCTRVFRSCSPLQRVNNRDIFMEMSTRLQETTRNIFTQHRWLIYRLILPLHRRSTVSAWSLVFRLPLTFIFVTDLLRLCAPWLKPPCAESLVPPYHAYVLVGINGTCILRYQYLAVAVSGATIGAAMITVKIRRWLG